MKNSRKWIGLIALALVMGALLTACGGAKYEPQAINEETDVCEICKMTVKDDQYATQIITKDGRSLKFDDVGCMNEWKVQNGTDTIGAAFVRDYNTKQWLPYEKAVYVYDESIRTPMAYGVVSFENKDDAEAFMNEHQVGKLMSAEQLADHTWEANHEQMGDHGHSHGEGDSSGSH